MNDHDSARSMKVATGRSSANRPGPRLVVLGVLMACFAWALIVPISLTEPPTTFPGAAFLVGLAGFGAALMLVLWTAVSPRPSPAAAWRKAALLLVFSMALWAPTHIWAERDEHAWAWLAGFAIAACALMSWQTGAVMAVILGAAASIGGIVFDGAIAAKVLTVLGCAVVVWAMCQALVWLLRLLWRAQEVREAQTALAIAEERLRVSRELHDVLGHRLGIIALKAELAADLTARDPGRAATECEGIRGIATETLVDVRRAVHGRTVADLGTQLQAAELVLHSAGIEASVDADQDLLPRMPQTLSHLLAAVVREAVTNVLRHSDARHVSITIAAAGQGPTLVIVNDGVHGSGRNETSGGSGLATLSDSCAAVGARLTVDRSTENRFELRVECSHDLARS
ncbi:sensor histidine kinase [Rhodococcus sp. NPDC019627]|uniref:sensor histidine kinase n=1 Tax=unclassified Rhodococcus (in: high G+C Gram-positive bacteria) TaxID=192944 RepID=UPI0033D00DDE